MDKKGLIELLQLGEDQATDFQARFSLSNFGQIICSFLNTSGGYIVCGVSDEAEVVGFETECETAEIEGVLLSRLSPKAMFSIDIVDIEGKAVLVIEVPKGLDQPYGFDDEIFVRSSGRVVKASVEQIKDMVLKGQVEPARWERRFSSASIEGDLDPDVLAAVVGSAKENLRHLFGEQDDKVTCLKKMSVVSCGKLTNGGDVLFSKSPEARHPQTRVTAVCLEGDETDSSYTDMRSFEGPLFDVLNKAYSFIVQHTQKRSIFPEGELQRKSELVYPAEAIREGLINAFAHRDYSDYKGQVSVRIYPNRLVIYNSGRFPEGINPEKLGEGHISVLRNPDIAHVMYIYGLMEKVGRGSLLIRRLCRERNLPLPTWSDKDGVTLTFWPEPGATPQVTPQDTPQVTPQVAELLKVLHSLGEEQDRGALQGKLRLKDRKHFRLVYLAPALDDGFIEMTLPDKPNSRNQKYRLSEKGRVWVSQNLM